MCIEVLEHNVLLEETTLTLPPLVNQMYNPVVLKNGKVSFVKSREARAYVAHIVPFLNCSRHNKALMDAIRKDKKRHLCVSSIFYHRHDRHDVDSHVKALQDAVISSWMNIDDKRIIKHIIEKALDPFERVVVKVVEAQWL